MTRSIVIIGIGLLIGFVAVQLIARGKKSPLTQSEVQQSLVIDVRSPAEFASGHFKNAVNIPLDELPNKTTELKAETRPIIVYCRSGNRSARAIKVLASAGIQAKNGVSQVVLEGTR